ncbi:MAG: alpha/beta hydrolase [Candidatus Latescibacteria bacterium]|nr:alpha/beta hydrolase [Candidatus Latescibacterota bacterium]
MPSFTKGDVTIQYEEAGSGFPLLVTPGGGLNSVASGWPRQVINAFEEFSSDFRCITMDQRNAGGGSTGPVQVDDPWGAFADDQLSLLDHLGVRQFGFIGFCIGGPFALRLMKNAPNRIVAAVLCQPVGSNAEFPDSMYDSGQNQWGPGLMATRPDLTSATIDAYLHNLYRDLEPDFVYSVSRDFVRSCQTPMLVMPDNTPSHSYEVALEVAELAPNAESTVYPWKEDPEILAATINQVREFLKSHVPA